MHWRTVAAVSIVWRVIIALATRTFFQPDEFFQSLEVAHNVVFGYGHLTWEWRIENPIRSIIFPALYMPAYWLTKVTRLDDGPALILLPKIVQGLIAALTDVGTYFLARRTVGERYATVSLLLSLSSFFHLLALTRTLSNSVETSFNTLALCCLPWDSRPTKQQLYAAYAFAALACVIRPTCGVLWLFITANQMWCYRRSFTVLRDHILVLATVGCFSFLVMFISDSRFYGKWVFTPINFLRINLSSVSLFYGRSPWHFYISQGLPLLLTTSLPFFLQGVRKTVTSGQVSARRLLYLVVWTVLVFSATGHKEWRFLHPLLPPMLVIASLAFVETGDEQRRRIGKSKRLYRGRILTKRLLFTTIGMLPGLYVMTTHSRAQIGVVAYLRTLDKAEIKSIGFLMPCHSIPWQSHLHQRHLAPPGLMWSLGCEPPVGRQNSSGYQDQTDVFYDAPLRYLQERFPARVDEEFPQSPYPADIPGSSANQGWEHSWPSHLVIFGALLRDYEGVEEYIRKMGYQEAWAMESVWEEDSRRRGGVRVWVYGGADPWYL